MLSKGKRKAFSSDISALKTHSVYSATTKPQGGQGSSRCPLLAKDRLHPLIAVLGRSRLKAGLYRRTNASETPHWREVQCEGQTTRVRTQMTLPLETLGGPRGSQARIPRDRHADERRRLAPR